MNNNQLHNNNDITAFINGIYEFVLNSRNFKRLSDLLHYSLQTLLNFPGSFSASLFILNEDSFEFEHRISHPIQYIDINQLIFDKLVNDGIIGEAINNSKYSDNQIDYEKTYIPGIENYYLSAPNTIILPLRASNGIIGIILLFIDSGVEIGTPENKEGLLQSELFSIFFANLLENYYLNKKVKRVQSVLEQQIATRTIGILNSKIELQAILNSVQTGILVTDFHSNEIINANIKSAQMIGDEIDNIIGRDITNFLKIDFNDDDVSKNKLPFSQNFESLLFLKNGKIIPILRSFNTITVTNQKIRIEGFVDISERKKLEKTLKDANEVLELRVEERTQDFQLLVHKLIEEISNRKAIELELQEMLSKEKEISEMKNRFISITSHEFRTPLTIIRTSAEMLLKYANAFDDEEKEQTLNKITETVDTMTDLLENVLFIGKSDSNSLGNNSKYIIPQELCENVIDDLRLAQMFDRKINLDCRYNEQMFIDSRFLRLALINLINNAIKYSSQDSTVEVTVLKQNENIEFIVQDYGIGIPDDAQERIFEPFFRADNTAGVPGTGLGMSVILRSVELLNGKIELKSKINVGTTIKIIIPPKSQE